jgi:hypothetical protein
VRNVKEGREPIGVHTDTSKIVGVSSSLEPGTDWRVWVPDHKIVARGAAAAEATTVD